MKILYVITKANWGGAQRYVFDLATAAKAEGHEVAVVVGGEGTLTEKLTLAKIRVIPLPLRQHKTFLGDLFSFGPIFPLMRVFRKERPDVVHVNSAKAGGLGAFAARITGVPHILFTAHGWEFNAPHRAFSKIGIRFFSWLTLILAHGTIAVSEAIKRDVVRWPFVARHITVIRNGISCPVPLSREEARNMLVPHNAARYWIGMVSELHPTKCVADAIEAFARIAPAHPDTILVVIGEGKERSLLEKLIAQHALGTRVVLAGFKDNAPALLSAFDLFVHASSSEALGYVILEAGCAGLPVVATRVGGIPEIITNDSLGMLVPPRNPAALATTIDELLQNPAHAKELGSNLREHIKTHFSKNDAVSKTFALYGD